MYTAYAPYYRAIDKLLDEHVVEPYFTEQMNVHQSSAFDIPFTRQQLADYLAVDRSAMSCELSKMQKDGLIRYNLNHFELIAETE